MKRSLRYVRSQYATSWWQAVLIWLAMLRTRKARYIGSNFDDFLREEGILGEVEHVATKRVADMQASHQSNTRKR